MRPALLPFSPPAIGEEEIQAVIDVLRSGWPTTGPRTRAFEQEFCAKFGIAAAAPVSSCTAALHLALLAVGVKPGDKVITTPFTFCSTAHAIEYCGAEPVFVDVDARSLNISAERIEHALAEHSNVKALLPVHLYGHPCDLDVIYTLAAERGVAVVEDAAHAIGAKYKGRYIGDTQGSKVPAAVCFSFYATKNITTIEGGMLSGQPDIVARARSLSFLGIDRSAWQRVKGEQSWRYDVGSSGFKYNLSDLSAAIGRVQLERFDQMQARRRQIAETYSRELSSLAELELPRESSEVTHAWHLYVIRLRTEMLGWSEEHAQDNFISCMRELNIATSVHFTPLHLQPYFREKYGLRPEHLPVATRESRRIVTLPLYPAMSADDVADVVDAVNQVIANNRR